jgi:hypothetical protein
MRRRIAALLAGLVLTSAACGGGDSFGPASIARSSVALFDPQENSTLTGTVSGATLTLIIDGGFGVFTLRFTR